MVAMSLGLSMLAALTACGSASWDGEQWYQVTVRNDTLVAARLVTSCRDCTPARDRDIAVVHPGGFYAFTADVNNDPQAIRVTSLTGRPLGCLVLRYLSAPPHPSAPLSSVAPCPAGVRMVP